MVKIGRIVGNRPSGELPEAMLIEPVQIRNPGAYVARAISDVFVKDGMSFPALQGPRRIQKE